MQIRGLCPLGGIAKEQHRDQRRVLRLRKFLMAFSRMEQPATDIADAEVGRLQHHLCDGDGRVHHAEIELPDRMLCGYFLIIADNQNDRRVEMTLRAFVRFCQRFRRIRDENALGLKIFRRRRIMTGFEDQIELFLFQRSVAEFPHCYIDGELSP